MNHNKAIRQSGLFIGILTLAILSCSSAADLPSLFGTLTPTATHTLTPSPTSTPSPTPTATQMPSPTPLPTGVKAEEQPDGRTLFIDYDNRYQLFLPPGWEVVFSSREEIEQVIQEGSEQDPELAKLAKNFKDVDPDIFRLAAMNADRKFIRASGPTLLTINAFEDSIASSMPMAFVTAMIEDNILEGATSTTWDVVNNEHDVEVGIVRGTRVVSLPNEKSITLKELVIAFQANKKLIIIEVATPNEFGDQILAPFEDNIDSIEVKAE